MEYLIIAILAIMYFAKRGEVASCQEIAERTQSELMALKERITDADSYCKKKYNEVNTYIHQKREELNQYEKNSVERRNLIEHFINSKISEFPIVAEVIADYATTKDDLIAWQLEHKKHPARNGADEIRIIKQEKRTLIAQNKALRWEMQYLRSLIPWLDEIEDEPMEAKPQYINPDYNVNDDAAGYWLTSEEYNKLSTTEKYQLALNRYNHRKKSNPEIGREYERYIGYLYWKNGFDVKYFGIEKGKEDLGRDLICSNGGEIHVVQCKCWSNKANKMIRENHINQLFGTTMKYYLEQRDEKTKGAPITFGQSQLHLGKISIIPVFMSTVPFSETALKFATALNVDCQQVSFHSWPMIKCNINRKTGEKIYHLPFDQQYDKCIIDRDGEEFYAWTVKEAEEAGFRRAMRWRGNAN